MSNPIRYDPPLVRALAAELERLLAGRLAHPVPHYDADLSATLLLDRGEALRFDLHPKRGWVRLLPRPEGVEPRPAEARVARVAAPPDERLLRIDLQEGNRFRGGQRTLVVELHTNQWNALLVDAREGRIVSALRAREAGGRALRPGEPYHPPRPMERYAARGHAVDEAWLHWMETLGPVPPGERRRALLAGFADTSPVNAAAILGEAAEREGEDALEAAFGRWWEMETRAAAEPVLLHTASGDQPYPHPLKGVASDRFASILAAMEALAAAGEGEAAEAARPELLEPARRRLDGARRRVERLRGEMAGVGEADRLRARADLLMASLHLVSPGAEKVTVPDFEGGEVELALDPALRAHENAARWYDEARRRARAEERLPALLEAAEAEVRRWEAAVAAVEAGEPPEWLEGALRKAERRERAGTAAPAGERKPYRVYRTSGGLEVRVGRTSKDNDRLTFGHAAPEDVWLHARSVPGSHVVLRWTDAGAPPARDLEEAAVLAAVHSKARSSGTVAVDWTRRKHVRKPRGAPPGRVSVLRAKTLFVAPDPEVEERLRGETA